MNEDLTKLKKLVRGAFEDHWNALRILESDDSEANLEHLSDTHANLTSALRIRDRFMETARV